MNRQAAYPKNSETSREGGRRSALWFLEVKVPTQEKIITLLIIKRSRSVADSESFALFEME